MKITSTLNFHPTKANSRVFHHEIEAIKKATTRQQQLAEINFNIAFKISLIFCFNEIQLSSFLETF